MIDGMFTYGAMPALERMVQFTGERHRVLTNNIANLSTPFFEPTDLDVEGFQASLRDAIDKRREGPTPVHGQLKMRDTLELEFHDRHIEAHATPTRDNLMFHDRNNRDLERIMADLAENTMAHNAAIEMLRNQFSLLQTAIRERL